MGFWGKDGGSGIVWGEKSSDGIVGANEKRSRDPQGEVVFSFPTSSHGGM